MANRKFQILNRDTGKVFEHSALAQHKFFTTIKAVNEFVEENQGVTFSIHDSLGQELPHFFSDVPMFAIRHKMGKLWVPEGAEGAMWSKTCGRIASRFDRDPRLRKDIIPELKKPEHWFMVDQFLREKTKAFDRFFKVPNEAGMWGLLYNYAGNTGLVIGRTGNAWFKTLNGLKQFATNDNKMLHVEKYHKQMIVKQKRGYTAVRSTGHGEYELMPEVDLYL